MRRSGFTTALVACFFAVAVPAMASFPCQYEVEAYAPLPDGLAANGHDVNEGGLLVGRSHGKYQEFSWTPVQIYWGACYGAPDLTMTHLDAPGVTGGAEGVNNVGVIAGWSRASGLTQACTWSDGTRTYLPGLLPGAYETEAYAINDARQIVGYTEIDGGFNHAVLWDADGTVHDLGALYTEHPEFAFSVAYDINRAGEVVGGSTYSGAGIPHAFLWRDGEDMQDLGGGALHDIIAHGVNNATQIVGYDETGARAPDGGFIERPWLWTEPDGLTTLPHPAADYWYTEAEDINDAGVIVGHSTKDNSGTVAADGCVWYEGGTHLLDDLLVPGSGWHITKAAAINNAWQIAASGRNAAGDAYAILLKPTADSVPMAAPDFGVVPGPLPAGWSASGAGAAEAATDPHDPGNVVAQLTTGSPIVLTQTVDTPAGPFIVSFDYEFTTTTGELQVILDGTVLDTTAAPDPLVGAFMTHSIPVTEAALRGLTWVDLDFALDGPAGSQVLLDNVAILGLTPEPATLALLALGGLGVLVRRRRK